jgi:hypothetical protein
MVMSGLDNSTLRDFLKFVKFDGVNLTENSVGREIIDWREDIAGNNKNHTINECMFSSNYNPCFNSSQIREKYNPSDSALVSHVIQLSCFCMLEEDLWGTFRFCLFNKYSFKESL